MGLKFIKSFDEDGKIEIPKEIIDGIFHGRDCNQKQMGIWLADDMICMKEHIVIDDEHCVWKDDRSFKLAESTCGEHLDTHRVDTSKLKYCPYCGKHIKFIYK